MSNNSNNVKYDIARLPPKDTIKMLTVLLEKIIKTNEQQSGNDQRRKSDVPSSFTCFQARSVPSISIYNYLTRILKYCPCANECFLALLAYFDRMSNRVSGLRIDSFNIHRLIIAGVMVASKLFSDIFFTNTRYAKVGGLPISELNVLELEFLAINNFSLFVSLEELQSYGDQLLNYWYSEQTSTVNTPIKRDETAHLNEQEELAPPVRRRARHLSIDSNSIHTTHDIQHKKSNNP